MGDVENEWVEIDLEDFVQASWDVGDEDIQQNEEQIDTARKMSLAYANCLSISGANLLMDKVKDFAGNDFDTYRRLMRFTEIIATEFAMRNDEQIARGEFHCENCRQQAMNDHYQLERLLRNEDLRDTVCKLVLNGIAMGYMLGLGREIAKARFGDGGFETDPVHRDADDSMTGPHPDSE